MTVFTLRQSHEHQCFGYELITKIRVLTVNWSSFFQSHGNDQTAKNSTRFFAFRGIDAQQPAPCGLTALDFAKRNNRCGSHQEDEYLSWVNGWWLNNNYIQIGIGDLIESCRMYSWNQIRFWSFLDNMCIHLILLAEWEFHWICHQIYESFMFFSQISSTTVRHHMSRNAKHGKIRPCGSSGLPFFGCSEPEFSVVFRRPLIFCKATWRSFLGVWHLTAPAPKYGSSRGFFWSKKEMSFGSLLFFFVVYLWC